ncbi:MAG: hypothetical protein D3923_04245 [Candidatus Electrothrix sp. AR3]|nr:hypothetical protein [Candidatus Electrothrix sp. AR3]
MNTICLVKGGTFLLGIDIQDIITRTTYDKVAQDSTCERMFHLGALLSQQPCSTLESNAPCLQLKTQTGSLFLLVDQVMEEIELKEEPIPLPSTSPSLAKQLCPQAVIHGTSAVMLLASTEIESISEQLGDGIGWTAVKALLVNESPPQEKEQSKTEEEDLVAAEPETEDKSTAASIDEETFKKIMSWTITQFKQSNKKDLSMEQLPPNLAKMIEQKGLSMNVIQYLIEQIVFRCQESMHQGTTGEQDAG